MEEKGKDQEKRLLALESLAKIARSHHLSPDQETLRVGRYHSIFAKDSQGRLFFIKKASGESLKDFLDAEVTWGQVLPPLLSPDAPLILPKMVAYQHSDWLICEALKRQDSLDGKDMAKWVDCCVETILFLKSIATRRELSVLSNPRYDKENTPHLLKENVATYSKEPLETGLLAPEELDRLKAIIFDGQEYGSSLEHGDFSQAHMFVSKPFTQIALIDAEWSSASAFAYADVAQFYNLNFTKFGQPDNARRFLQKLFEKVEDKDYFARQFMIFSAYRLICKMRDFARSAKTSSAEGHQTLKKQILSGFEAML